jgi:hypothetical protein
MSIDYRKLLKDVLRGGIIESDRFPQPHPGPMQAWIYDPVMEELIDDSGVQWTTDEEEQAFREIVEELREEYRAERAVNPVAGPPGRFGPEWRERGIFGEVLECEDEET